MSTYDIKMIDEMVNEGRFTSRSDAIRYSVRRQLESIDSFEAWRNEMARIADEKGITAEDIRKAAREARKVVYKEVYGDD